MKLDAIQCFPLCTDYTVGRVETEMMLRRATIYMITNTLTVYISRDTEKDVKPSSLTLALLVLLYSPISPIVANEKKKSKSASLW